MDNYDMIRIVEGVRYDTEKSYLLAYDQAWNGTGHDRTGRNTFLFRSVQAGRFFQVLKTVWEWERDTLIPLTRDQALRLYEVLPVKDMSLEEAFPEVELVEA